ncbi:hypothetical protein H7Y29_01255 [Microbacteriaceae bacterium]|nr:hypothetical protein [Candidatus Saccharibacteria bacterium]
MSEKAPKAPQSDEAIYRASLHDTPTGTLLSQVDELVGDRFRVTANDRLQLKAGTTAIDADGNAKNVGGRFESKHQLEDIVAFEDQIRLGMKAKEISSVAPEIDAALDFARDQVATMNETQNATLKEAAVMRHALVKSKAISALEVGNMSDDEVRNLVDYMRHDHEANDTSGTSKQEHDPAPTQHEFAVGQSVRVLRSAGNIEDGWYVHQQLDGDNYEVVRDVDDNNRLVKTVEGAELKLWNTVDTSEPFTAPSLTPIDTPASEAVIVGEVVDTSDGVRQDATDTDRENPRVITLENVITGIKNIPNYLAARMATTSFLRNNGEAATPERRKSRKLLVAGVGALAVGVVGYMAFRGHDTSGVHDIATGNSFDTPLQDVALPGTGNNAGGGHDMAGSVAQVADHTSHFSNEALTAARGEGWNHQLHDMGFSSSEILGVLKKLSKSTDPAIREWVYTMKDGNPGITKPGQIPANVLQSIQKLR